MVIAVGYRVNSKKATRFHQWATKTLHEYIQKGFDDYITKPFRPLELVARVKAQLRRFTRYNPAKPAQDENTIVFSGLVLNKDKHECLLDEKPVALTPTEFAILWFLSANRGDPIPQQRLETIFERFFRLDAARSSQTGGAGLGLSIAREIVAAHGGTISVESGNEHTVFTVILPLGEKIRKS